METDLCYYPLVNTHWRNRTSGRGEVAPDQLLANPHNWRVHPAGQQRGLEKVLDEVGWVNDIIVNQRTGFVIDGHARVALALRRHEKSVPVRYVDLSEAEERLVLATFDALGSMAVADLDQLDVLTHAVDEDGFGELLKSVALDGLYSIPTLSEPSQRARVTCPNCGEEFTLERG